MNSGFRRVLLVGKRRDKIEFIKEFLSGYTTVHFEEICNKQEKVLVQLKHCSGYECKIQKDSMNIIIITSFWFPTGMTLEADMSTEKRWIDSHGADLCGMVLFLCSYPWKTAEFFNNLQMIPEHLYKNVSCQPVQYCAVRWIASNQRFGATDIIEPEKVIAEIPSDIYKYLKQSPQTEFVASLLKCPVYRNRQDFLEVISGFGQTLTVLTEESKKRFEKWHQKVIEFPSEYFSEHPDYLGTYMYDFPIDLQEKFENLTNQGTFYQVTTFESVKGCTDIIQRFREKYYQQNHDVIFRVADEIYKRNVQEIYFWNID